jgi:hypothetical protein
MKPILLFVLALFLLTLPGKSQISLIGAIPSQNFDGVEIATWDVMDSSSVITYPTDLVGYYMASSVFDAYHGNYYITGITEDNSGGLLSFNTKTLEQDFSGYTNFSNITEIDMATGKIYSLSADSMEYFSVNEYDIETGLDSLLGVVYEPGTNGIVVDAIAFNSNDGILYYIGYDNVPNTILYSIPVRNEVFSYSETVIIPNDPINSYFSLNYDNLNDKLFALNMAFDSTGNFSGTSLVEINTLTGEVIPRSPLSEFYGFVAGSSAFDQNTGSYLVSAIDTNNIQKMIVFDTYTNTYVNGFSPPGVSEIVCDNTVFATETYITTAIKERQTNPISFYPNPADTKLTVTIDRGSVKDLKLGIYDITGKQVIQQSFRNVNQVTLDVSSLIPGMYILKSETEEGSKTSKLVIR